MPTWTCVVSLDILIDQLNENKSNSNIAAQSIEHTCRWLTWKIFFLCFSLSQLDTIRSVRHCRRYLSIKRKKKANFNITNLCCRATMTMTIVQGGLRCRKWQEKECLTFLEMTRPYRSCIETREGLATENKTVKERERRIKRERRKRDREKKKRKKKTRYSHC